MLNVFKFTPVPLLLGFPIAVIAYRLQLWEMGTSFKLILFTGFVSAVLLILAISVGIFSFIKKRDDVVKPCVVTVLLLVIPVAGLSMQALKSKSLPFIHHVSTDTINLPQFNAIIPLRGDDSNPLEYDREKLAPIQQKSYPDLKSIISELSTEQAFNQAVNIVDDLGWEIVSKNSEQGIIEAVDTTLLWAFKDDVVIRIEASDTGSKIDLRSISRVGRSDLGANAERIRSFISAFSTYSYMTAFRRNL